jgi:hypothetical protein
MPKPKTEPRDTTEIINADGSLAFFAGWLKGTISDFGKITVADWNQAIEATLEEVKLQAERRAAK